MSVVVTTKNLTFLITGEVIQDLKTKFIERLL